MTPPWNLLFGLFTRPLSKSGAHAQYALLPVDTGHEGTDENESENDTRAMVQMYGAAPERERVEAEGGRGQQQDGEGAALLGADATSKKPKHLDGVATLTSSVGNLANTIIGSGMCCLSLS